AAALPPARRSPHTTSRSAAELTFDQIKELFRSNSAAVKELREVSAKLAIKELAIRRILETLKCERVSDERLVETFSSIAAAHLKLLTERGTIGSSAARGSGTSTHIGVSLQMPCTISVTKKVTTPHTRGELSYIARCSPTFLASACHSIG